MYIAECGEHSAIFVITNLTIIIMIIIKNKFIPFGRYESINLFGILFTKGYVSMEEENHEKIHTEQIKECTCIGFAVITFLCWLFGVSILWWLACPCTFYVLYGLEYVLIRLFHKKQNDAYHDVSFEEEAYNNQDDIDYLKYRFPFSWIKYVKPKSK